MIRDWISRILLLCCTLLLPVLLFAQNKSGLEIQIDKNILVGEEPLIISITAENPNPIPEGIPYRFPELPGFKKVGLSRSRSNQLVNGKAVPFSTYAQYYQALNPGVFNIPALEFNLFGISAKNEAFTVNVSKPENRPEEALELEPNEVAGNSTVFLRLRSTKTKPWLGEGFTLTWSLYVAESNAQALAFERLNEQIPQQLKKLNLGTCWQENFDIQETKVLNLRLNGKNFKEYRFFQSTYFALDPKPISLPSLELSLRNTKSSKTSYQRFQSPALKILPKALPQGLNPNKIPVGNFLLKEKLDQIQGQTGQRLTYEFQVIGDGNSLLWENRPWSSDYFLNLNTQQAERLVYPQNEKILGNYSEKVEIIPQQPGKFALRKYFYWVYFNASKGKLDTLKSNLFLTIQGRALDQVLSTQNEKSEVYRGIEQPNFFQTLASSWTALRSWANWGISIIIIAFFLYWWKDPKS